MPTGHQGEVPSPRVRSESDGVGGRGAQEGAPPRPPSSLRPARRPGLFTDGSGAFFNWEEGTALEPYFYRRRRNGKDLGAGSC